MPDQIRHLRVLIANENRDRRESLAQVVTDLGHEAIAPDIDVREVAEVSARQDPDVALVGLELHSEEALVLVSDIVGQAECPVIALLVSENPDYIHEAAKRGVFAYIVDTGSEELQSALDITLRRFGEYHSLQGTFGRRAVIEQAKGILMARHGVDADSAFAILRNRSQRRGVRLSEVAASIVDGNPLSPPTASERASSQRQTS